MSPSVEPFDKAKYDALTDGLECCEITLKSILQTTYDFRIESEFFAKKYLSFDNKLKNIPSKTLQDGLAHIVTDGTHFTPNYVENGIPFLSALNVKKGYLDLDVGYKHITPQEHKTLCGRVLPRKNDVLLRKVGVGARLACVIPDLPFEFSIFVSVALIRGDINPYYLSMFINSKFGQAQLIRFNKGISQPDLHLEDIARLRVPLFSNSFYNCIQNEVQKAEQCLSQAKQEINTAEQNFLHSVNIKFENYSSVSVKTLSNSFRKAERLDAEYYQLKYDTLFDTLSKLNTANLSGQNGLVSIKKSIEPGSEAYQDEGIPFLRVSDINKYEIVEPNIKLSSTTIPNIESLYPRKDTILLSKDGSVGIAYKVQENMQIVTSGALLHLIVKDTNKVLPDYLTLVLNSQVVQLQAERDCNGAIIQHWKPSDIEKVLIPILDMDKQKEISDKVQESFRLRKEAKRLLDNAIKAVEMAIETDEESALLWLRLQE